MIYLVRETGWDSCSHLALVEGPEMPHGDVIPFFRALFETYERERKTADEAFVAKFGWYNTPTGALGAQEHYHERRRDELRKAGCWNFGEFLARRGFRPVTYQDVALSDQREDDEH